MFAGLFNILFLGSLYSQNQGYLFQDPSTGKQVGPSYDMGFAQDNGNTIVCEGCQCIRPSWDFEYYAGGKWGVINSYGELVIPLEYSYIEEIDSRFYSVSRSNLKGIIDNRGEVFAKCIYKEIFSWYLPDFVIARNSDGYLGLFDLNGKIILDFKFEEIWIYGDYCIAADERGKRVFDLQGKQFLPSYYDNIDLITNESELYFKVQLATIGQLLDNTGKLIIENKGLTQFYNFDYDLIGFQISNNNKFGIVDFSGKQILPAKYSEITPMKISGDEYYRVTLNNKRGLLDKSGKLIIPVKYDFISTDSFGKYVIVSNSGEWKGINEFDGSIQYIPNYLELIDVESKNVVLQIKDFEVALLSRITATGENKSNSYLFANKNGNWGVLDQNLKEVLPFEFSSLQLNNNLIIATKGAKVNGTKYDFFYTLEGGEWGAFNSKFENIIPFEYEKIEIDEFNNFSYKVSKSGLIGYLNDKGKSVVPPQFVSVGRCSSSSCIISNIDSNTSEVKYGIIDSKSGKVLQPATYNELNRISRLNLFIAKKEELFGVINEYGKIILDLKYSFLQELSPGYYLTNESGDIQGTSCYGGKFGVISSTGSIILNNEYQKIEPLYGSDSLIICSTYDRAFQKLFNLKTRAFVNIGGFEYFLKIPTFHRGLHEIYESPKVFVAGNNVVMGDYGEIVSGKFGVVDYEGKVLVPANYTEIDVQKYCFIAVDSVSKKSDLYSLSGKQLLKDFSKLVSINDSLVLIAEKSTENYVYNVKSQKNVFKQGYSSITPILLYGREPRFVVEKDGKFGVINLHGQEIVTFEYCNIKDESRGDYFVVGSCVNTDAGQASKFGIVNNYGHTILNMEFDSIISTQKYPITFICLKNGIESEFDIYGNKIIK